MVTAATAQLAGAVSLWGRWWRGTPPGCPPDAAPSAPKTTQGEKDERQDSSSHKKEKNIIYIKIDINI